MARNLITDVAGVRVGSADDAKLASGVTAVIFDEPAVASIAIHGGAPAVRDTALLEPEMTVERVDGFVVSGGSAFGLDSVAHADQPMARRALHLGVEADAVVMHGDAHVLLVEAGQADLTKLMQARQRLIQLQNNQLDAVWQATQAQSDLLLALGMPSLIHGMLNRAEEDTVPTNSAAPAAMPPPSLSTSTPTHTTASTRQ